jgi:hypothetical protein
MKETPYSRSGYAIGFPWRDNWVIKEEGFVVGATARPGSRRGLPPGVTVFANTTSAKTRATATLRQRHIPPNVVCKKIKIN